MITRERLDEMYQSIDSIYGVLEDCRDDKDADELCLSLSTALDYLTSFQHTVEVRENRERFKTLLNGFMKENPNLFQCDKELIEFYISKKNYSALLHRLAAVLKNMPTDSDVVITPEDVHEVGELFELATWLLSQDKESD